MRIAARLLSYFWLLLAVYVLTVGWNTYHVSSKPILGPLISTEAYIIAEQLQTTITATHAKRAQALLLDSTTNKVVASVTCRSVALGGGCGEDWSFLSDRWEPGSAFKPILVATMVDSGHIKTTSTFSDKGYVMADGYRIDNHEGNVPTHYNIEQFLGTSRNTGAIMILKTSEESSSPTDIWHATLQRVIAGQGYTPNFKHLRDQQYRFYESSFGVGLTITPLRLAQLYNSFQSNGQVCDQNAKCAQFIKPATAQYMQQLLQHVAIDYAGVKSDNPYCVYGGKSGTALVAQSTGTYQEDVNDGTYVGMIANTIAKKNELLLIRLDAPNDALASRPARLSWIPIANKLCQNL